MTSRHHYAELLRHDGEYAVYRFTPDSITKQQWGVVRFRISNCELEIVEYAETSHLDHEYQQSACSALAHKLKTHMAARDDIPLSLEFVA